MSEDGKKVQRHTIKKSDELDFEELKFDKMLGKGSSGVVQLAYWRGTKVAVKKIQGLTMSPKEYESFSEEIQIHK